MNSNNAPDEVCPDCGGFAYLETYYEWSYVGHELKCNSCRKYYWYDDEGKFEKSLTFKEKDNMRKEREWGKQIK
jgi:hypothetical protein